MTHQRGGACFVNVPTYKKTKGSVQFALARWETQNIDTRQTLPLENIECDGTKMGNLQLSA